MVFQGKNLSSKEGIQIKNKLRRDAPYVIASVFELYLKSLFTESEMTWTFFSHYVEAKCYEDNKDRRWGIFLVVLSKMFSDANNTFRICSQTNGSFRVSRANKAEVTVGLKCSIGLPN